MAEYIEREATIREMKMDIEPPFKVVMKMPAVDVVPKSEVEVLQGALKAEERHNELTMEMAKKALANAKQEVAREIFEEIEKITMHNVTSSYGIWLMSMGEDAFAELKKKYTEETE